MDILNKKSVAIALKEIQTELRSNIVLANIDRHATNLKVDELKMKQKGLLCKMDDAKISASLLKQSEVISILEYKSILAVITETNKMMMKLSSSEKEVRNNLIKIDAAIVDLNKKLNKTNDDLSKYGRLYSFGGKNV